MLLLSLNSSSIEPLLCQVKDPLFCIYCASIEPSIEANSCFIEPLLCLVLSLYSSFKKSRFELEVKYSIEPIEPIELIVCFTNTRYRR